VNQENKKLFEKAVRAFDRFKGMGITKHVRLSGLGGNFDLKWNGDELVICYSSRDIALSSATESMRECAAIVLRELYNILSDEAESRDQRESIINSALTSFIADTEDTEQ